MLKNGKSLDFKRFSGIEKARRNSIKITVDLWRRARDFFGALLCTFASLCSLTTSAKTVHRTVFFRRQVCSLLVRISLFVLPMQKAGLATCFSFWRIARNFFGALPCAFASLRSLTTSAKTVHRTVFFRRQVCSLLVRIPLFIFANAKSRPCDLLFVLAESKGFEPSNRL